MTKPGETRVTVRVEVVVEGAGEAPRVTTIAVPCPQPAARGPRALEIISPPAGSRIPVFPFRGKKCIEANGTAVTLMGSFPGQVWAMVYPDPNLDPHQSGFASPPAGAACDTPNPVDGTWSFTQAKGNPVPGATCNGSGSGNNNTLVVWYFFGSGVPCSIESTPFFGFCVSGGGTSGSVAGSGSFGAPPPPATLHATFTGALAALGTVALAWNGATWLGLSGGCGGALLAFLGDGSSYTLLSAGPGTLFVVLGPPDSPSPFSWSAAGTALGSCGGPFSVTLTE